MNKNFSPGFQSSINLKAVFGCISIFVSAFAFYLATVVIKWSKTAGLDIDPAFFVFARFIFGFLTVLAVMAVQRKGIRVKKKQYLIGRTLSNCVAVYCFFKAISLTSVAQANILNMTYPLFIAVFSWIFLKEQRDAVTIWIVLIAFSGVWLILNPKAGSGFNAHSLWGLASGISAAVAIIYLNLSRQVHDTLTTLFFLFGLGSVLILAVFYKQIYIPHPQELKYLFWCSVLAISGQYLLTIGFKYVTATEGGIISSTRILIAATLGPYLAMDPKLTVSGWIGACLIFSANVYLTLRKARK